VPKCPRCDRCPLDEPAYSYLLGLYLDDGHIVHARKTYLLSAVAGPTVIAGTSIRDAVARLDTFVGPKY
jgi:hypothetical protein